MGGGGTDDTQEKACLSLSKKQIRQEKVLLNLQQRETICPKVTLIFLQCSPYLKCP